MNTHEWVCHYFTEGDNFSRQEFSSVVVEPIKNGIS